ncbi:MAG: dihydropteroate synthase [Ferruginibacter sp.]
MLETPVVMGIINVTPDSFYRGSLYEGKEDILMLANKMITDGAGILDVGGQSTRPGSQRISANEELERVIPFIQLIRREFPNIIISTDTYSSVVARESVNNGADIINDISGGELDMDMIPTVASLKVPYICMHMKGTPATMHKNASYEDVTKEVLDYFFAKICACKKAGIHDVIIDPGFGFGKNIEHNFKLLKDLPVFTKLQKPLLVGLSRKSTIYRTLGVSAEEALNGTTVLNTLALQNGANILRVHDVKEAAEAIRLFSAYNK